MQQSIPWRLISQPLRTQPRFQLLHLKRQILQPAISLDLQNHRIAGLEHMDSPAPGAPSFANVAKGGIPQTSPGWDVGLSVQLECASTRFRNRPRRLRLLIHLVNLFPIPLFYHPTPQLHAGGKRPILGGKLICHQQHSLGPFKPG